MHNVYISAIYRPEAIFLALTVGSIYIPFYTANVVKKQHMVRWCVTVIQEHSRSLKLVPVKSPYATSY